MNAIDVPVEFKHMVRQVGADCLKSLQSVDGIVDVALSGVGPQQASVARAFLHNLLAQSLTSEALAEFWSSLPSGVYFTNGEFVRKVFEAVLARLEKEPYLTGNLPS